MPGKVKKQQKIKMDLLRQKPVRTLNQTRTRKVLFQKGLFKIEAKLAVVAQTRPGWIQEMRLSGAAEAGSKNK